MDTEKLRAYLDEFECLYYFDGRIASNVVVFPDKKMMESYDFFLTNGFRRYGNTFYKTVCEKCHECVPIRIKVEDFKPSKSQRHTLNKNCDIEVKRASKSMVTEEKLNLFIKYKAEKHNEKNFDMIEEGLKNLHYGFDGIIEMNYFIKGKLIGVGILDQGEKSLSSNYFYYDTDFIDRRIGVFSMLKEIEFCKENGKEYYYMGFYLKEIEKMAYKKYFRPNEILVGDVWEEFMK